MTPKFRTGILSLFFITALGAIVWPHIPGVDPHGYTDFADQRQFFGIPSAMDVLSNLAFLIVGGWGLLRWRRDRSRFAVFRIGLAVAIFLTGLGSAYFHVQPTLQSLFWDRLPMVLVFGIILGWLVADKVENRIGIAVAILLSLIGVATLSAWTFGHGDLKIYFLLQYGGLLVALLLTAFGQRGVFGRSHFLAAFGLYISAKFFEVFDAQVFSLFVFVSGHTVKHLISALAILVLLGMKGSVESE